MEPIPHEALPRLRQVFLLLSSVDGERSAAASALNRLLAQHGATWHGLAKLLEVGAGLLELLGRTGVKLDQLPELVANSASASKPEPAAPAGEWHDTGAIQRINFAHRPSMRGAT